MTPDSLLEPFEAPQRSPGDEATTVAKALISALPGATEIYDRVIGSPLQRRTDEWMQRVSSGLNALFARVDRLTPEALATDDAFVSAALRASQQAILTTQEEKLTALRNAVLNVAAGRGFEEDEQAQLLDLVGSLTGWHLRLLRFLQDPHGVARERGIQLRQAGFSDSVAQRIEEVFPELKGSREVYDRLGTELHQRQLSNTDGFHTMLSASGALVKRTTPYADRFIAFISEPPELAS